MCQKHWISVYKEKNDETNKNEQTRHILTRGRGVSWSPPKKAGEQTWLVRSLFCIFVGPMLLLFMFTHTNSFLVFVSLIFLATVLTDASLFCFIARFSLDLYNKFFNTIWSIIYIYTYVCVYNLCFIMNLPIRLCWCLCLGIVPNKDS